jgi:hypothetical protein
MELIFLMKITLQIYCVRGILFLALILFPITSIAGIVELIPGIRIAVEYDDNIDFKQNSSNADDDFSGSATPNVRLMYNTERLDLIGRAEIDFKKYLNDTDYDRTNHLYEIQTEYQAHSRWRLSGEYSFRRDETIDSQFEETGRTFERKRQERHDATGGVQFALTELTGIGSFVTYRRANYSGSDNTDYDYYTVELPYAKRFQNQIDTIRLTPSYTRYYSDDNEKADGYRLTLFWEHLLSETLTFDINIGGRYTDIEEQNGDSNSNFGIVGNIGLAKIGETFSGEIRYSRDLRSTTAGEIVNVDRLSLLVDKLLTERFGFNFRGNGYHSTRENDNRSNDKVVSFDLTPAFYYRLTENHSVRLAYSYRHQRDLDEPGNPTAQRNQVVLSFNFAFPQRWD